MGFAMWVWEGHGLAEDVCESRHHMWRDSTFRSTEAWYEVALQAGTITHASCAVVKA